jgi:cell division septation protein DedD
MANSQTEGNETRDDMSGIKRKLARRMAVAGLMIVGLLGGLALFDYYSALPDGEKTSDVPQFTEPVPVPKKMATQPVTPVEPDAPTDVPPAEPESSAAPVDTVGLIGEPPPPPVVAARPALPDAARRPSPTVAKPAEAAAPAPATRPTMPEQSAGAVSPTPLPPPRRSTGYALQVGVFSDPRRAEDLLARLTQEGIPATIEARVHVGPFKSQKEADAARVKLKALGLDSVLLPPKGVKR